MKGCPSEGGRARVLDVREQFCSQQKRRFAMRLRNKLALGLVSGLVGLGVCSGVSRADTITTWSFSFFSTDPSVNVTGGGKLISDSDMQPAGEQPGEFFITGGDIDTLNTGGHFSVPPPFDLFTVTNGSATYSPSGYFIFDNQLFPSTSVPVDNPGLLFKQTGTGDEINIFASDVEPDGTPILYYENSGFNTPITLDLDASVVSSVPLPASAGVGFSMLGVIAVVSVLRKQLSSRTRIA
jgi:hypothetical protein